MNLVYKALSDPTRRRILELLREGDKTAGALADQFSQAKPTISKHFSVLKEADLIEGTREGTTITYTLNVSLLEEAILELMNTFDLSKTESATKPSTRKKHA